MFYQFEKTFDTETVQHASIYLLFAYKSEGIRQFDYVLINSSRQLVCGKCLIEKNNEINMFF